MIKEKTLCFLFLLLTVSAGLYAGEFEDTVTKGNQWVQKKDYKKAIEEYHHALKINPKNSKISLLLGLTYANIGDLDNAVKFTEDSLKIEPSYSAYQNLGLIYANRGDLNKAYEAYQKALTFNPRSYQPWYQIGLLQASRGNFNDAIQAYQKCLELNPFFTDTYLSLASAYYWSGNRAKAIEQVDRLKRLKAKDQAQALEDWIKNKDNLKSQKTPAA